MNLEYEQLILGAILRDNSVLSRVPDLTVDHFFFPDHKSIFATILRLANKDIAADAVTVSEKLPEVGFDYIAELANNVPSIANAKTYAARVIEDAMRRTLKDVTSELAEEIATDKTTSVAELIETAQSRIMSLTTSKSEDSVVASAALLPHLQTIEDRSEGRVKKISTGFCNLDAVLNGGFVRSNMVIIGARPSMGKTALALNIAAHIAKTETVLFLSQEMSTGELLDRLLSSIGQIPLSNLLNGRMTDEDYDCLTRATTKIERLRLLIDEQGGLTLADVRSKARRVKQVHGLDVVFLDYLQLMNGSGANRNAEIEEISRGLKNLAKELNIVVVCLSQLNRAVEQRPNKMPVMSDLRDSGSIEQDANIILFLHRDEVYDPDTPAAGFADLLIRKNRQGQTGNLAMKYIGEQTRFCETTERKPEEVKSRKTKGIEL